LIPYLGSKKYEDLCKSAFAYNPTYDPYVDRVPPLSHCDDPLIHELFIAIIRLFNLFCEYSETVSNPSSKRLFEDVSLSLNDNGRETGLFNCLEVPNDEVKLAVVECLNNVPLSEFDNEEIS
jgi:hypothetical protein